MISYKRVWRFFKMYIFLVVPGEHAAELAVRVQHLGPAP